MATDKIKVLYIITKSNWGGAQRHVFDLASNLPKGKFEAVVAAGGDGPLHQKLAEVKIRTVSIKSLERDINTTKEALSFWQFFKLLQAEKPNVIHLHSPKAGGLGALAGRLYNLFVRLHNLLPTTRSLLPTSKIIYTVHGWPFNENRSFWEKISIKVISYLTVVLSHRTIVISKSEYNQARNFFGARKKIIKIYNGINRRVKPRNRLESRAKFQKLNPHLENKSFWVGAVAELHKNKGLNFAVLAWPEIIAKHPQTALVIAGDGEERKELEKIITLNGLENSVFLLGAIENANQELGAFDAFILPSLKEGFPYALLEAGLVSLPAIATSVGGISEIIEDMTSGILIQPKNPSEITQAVSYLLEHPEARQKMAKNLHKKVSVEFNLKKMLGQTYLLY